MAYETSDLEYRLIIALFPGLEDRSFTITSPKDVNYNCIAWALGDTTQCWWPDEMSYWPEGMRADESIEAFQECFQTRGYLPGADSALANGFEKVALYVDPDDRVSHAARQLPDGRWTSKIGQGWDIAHQLEALCGAQYGEVGLILVRRNPTS